MDPLKEYYEGVRDAPVPARLMAETPPEAFLRRLSTDLAWAAAGVALVLATMAVPTTPDLPTARTAAHALGSQVAMRIEVGR